MFKAIANLPDGTEIVLGEFDTAQEAHEFINKTWLGTKG